MHPAHRLWSFTGDGLFAAACCAVRGQFSPELIVSNLAKKLLFMNIPLF